MVLRHVGAEAAMSLELRTEQARHECYLATTAGRERPNFDARHSNRSWKPCEFVVDWALPPMTDDRA